MIYNPIFLHFSHILHVDFSSSSVVCVPQVIVAYRGDAMDVRKFKVAGDLGQVLFVPIDLKNQTSLDKAVKYSNWCINLIGRDWETKNFSFFDVHCEGRRDSESHSPP